VLRSGGGFLSTCKVTGPARLRSFTNCHGRHAIIGHPAIVIRQPLQSPYGYFPREFSAPCGEKSEIRISKSETNSGLKGEKSKLGGNVFRSLAFRILHLFRFSDFEFRICGLAALRSPWQYEGAKDSVILFTDNSPIAATNFHTSNS
jgi:hypothetical protein